MNYFFNILKFVAIILNIAGLLMVYQAILRRNIVPLPAEPEQMTKLKAARQYSKMRNGILIVTVGFMLELIYLLYFFIINLMYDIDIHRMLNSLNN